MSTHELYGYWRSSAAYRVRIALNLKGLSASHLSVDLRTGQQRDATHLARNPAGLVPVWSEADGFHLSQSLAIIDYLDRLQPEPPLLPTKLRSRAIVHEIALTIACDIHPIANLRVLEKLTSDFGAPPETRAAWARHWIEPGFDAVERRLDHTAGVFAFGNTPGLADICIVPQVYNARRFGMDLTAYPRISAVADTAAANPAFAAAHPDRQRDSAQHLEKK